MSEGFLRRWARLKSTGEEAQAEVPVPMPVQVQAPPPTAPAAAAAPPPHLAPRATNDEQGQRPALTLDDVARLTPESDYSAFVARGVDKAVQRMALKKLFAAPGFAAMDGLDIYISDYNKASPLTDEMLATLKHAPGVLSRLFGDDEQQGEPAIGADEAAVAAAPVAAQTPPPPEPGTP